MKILCFAGIALLASSASFGQGLEELQQRLAEKEAENRRLRERVEMLERALTPRRITTQRSEPASASNDEDDTNRALERALVRERGLLLSTKTSEVEANAVYSHLRSSTSDFRRDSYGPALVLRKGLPWRSQLDIGLPYVFERRRSNAVSTDAHGIGDLSIGLSHQFLAERPAPFSLIGAISYQAPTGRNTLFESTRPVSLGSGFNSMQGALTAVKRVDPMVYFGSYTFRHAFDRDKNGVNVRPGASHGLRLGAALAAGPTTSLRAAVNLGFFERTKIAGRAIPETDDPLALFEFGGSVVLSASTALDVLVGAGLTRNAPDFRISVALPVRF